MNQFLKQGMIFGDYELISPLKKTFSNMPTWMVKKADNTHYVARFLSSMSMANIPKRTLEPLQALPPIDGFIRSIEWQFVQLTDKITVLMIIRPYFPERLIDRFLPNTPHPTDDLLTIFYHLAKTFDMLETHYPSLNFDLSPGNLLMDGDKPILVDCGLAKYTHDYDMDMRIPISTYVEPERGVPLSACYPSMWQIWAATKSAYHHKIKRTDAQYALGALYVYIRTRFLIFENPAMLYPNDDTSSQLSFPNKIAWYLELEKIIRAYEEQGILDLPMIINEHEKQILQRALNRNSHERYVNCVTFVEALTTI